MAKKKKIRTEFRKNRSDRTRATDWTSRFLASTADDEGEARGERIGHDELTRKRVVLVESASEGDSPSSSHVLEVDPAICMAGRVLSVRGLTSTVRGDDGQFYECATRRLLKTLSTDQRHVVAAGDRVQFRSAMGNEGMIERIEPRRGVLSRTSRGRQHVIVANVDQLLIVSSAAEPYLKPNLIDRFLISAEKNRIRPLIVINKTDLVDRATLTPFVGVYAQMGYQVLLLSAETGFGVDRLRRALANRETAIVGQSGVGKSSLLNSIEPGLHLRVGAISADTEKGRHTTTTAKLIPLSSGGYVVDTPGIRQFQLWDVSREEVAGFYRDLRPLVNACRFPNCTHTHEIDCAVKDAVADGWLDARRYESYCHVLAGDVDIGTEAR